MAGKNNEDNFDINSDEAEVTDALTELPEIGSEPESASSVTDDDSLKKILSELKRQKIRRARQLMSKAKNKRNNLSKKPRKRNRRKNHITPLPATRPREKKYRQKSIVEKLRDKLKQAMETLEKAKGRFTEKLSEKAESFKDFFSNDKGEEETATAPEATAPEATAPEATAPEATDTLPDLSDDKADITRFSMYSPQLTDTNGNPSYTHLKDWNKQVKQMQKALESATGKAVRVLSNIDREGNAVATFDVDKEMEKIAEASFDSTLGNIETRYEYPEFSMSRDPYTNKVKKEHLYSGDIDDEEERQREEKEEKASKRKMLHTITLIVSVLTAIADITRRILTATLARASEIKKESVDAKNLGITYANMREYKAQETAMGMKEGTFVSAIGALQSATGDISNLDTNVIKELAKVMQGDVIEAINNGLGRSDPEKLMGMILDTYYKRGQAGINSLGQQVGKYQAERELATALEKAGLGDIAEILRNMFYTNDTGIYKGRVGRETPFEDYMKLVTAYTMGLTEVDYKKASELGTVIDGLKDKFELLKKNLETGLLVSLGSLIDKVNNWQIGMSAEEKIENAKTNTELNEKAHKRMLHLSEGAKAQYETSFKEAGVDVAKFNIKGVDTLDDYLAWVNTTKARGWRPEGDEAKEVYNNMLVFLRSEKGAEALKALHYAQVTGKLAEQAQADVDKGFQTGKVEYKASAYTDTNIDYLMRELVANTTSSQEYSAVSLYGKAYAGKNVQEALVNEDKMFQEYIEAKGGFDYEQALKSGASKNLTKALYNKAMEKYKNMGLKRKSPETWKKLQRMSQEELVKTSLNNRTLTQFDVLELFKTHAFKISDWGLSQDTWKLLRDSIIEKERKKASDYGAQQTIVQSTLPEAKYDTEVNKLFSQRQAESKVYATVTGYDPKTGQTTIKFELDLVGNGKKLLSKDFSFKADSDFSGVYNQKLDITPMFDGSMADMTRESMTNGSTR